MQIVAVLAVLGAALGQPDDPPDQDLPAAEQQDEQQTDTEAPPADQQQAEPPEASADTYPAEQQQTDTSAAGEQPGETGSDDAAAGLDEATGWRLGPTAWQNAIDQLYHQFGPGGPAQHYGRFIVRYVNIHSRQPVVNLDVTVRIVTWGGLAPEWDRVDEQLRTWICENGGRDFIGFGGVFVMRLSDQAGDRRSVTIARC